MLKEEDAVEMFYNKDFRAKLEKNPEDFIKKIAGENLANVEYKVVKSTKDVAYIVIPAYNLDLDEISAAANRLSNANIVSSVGSIGSAGTVGTIGGTASTISCVGTVGSFSTADCV